MTRFQIIRVRLTLAPNILAVNALPQNFDLKMFLTKVPDITLKVKFVKQGALTYLTVSSGHIVSEKIIVQDDNVGGCSLTLSFNLEEKWSTEASELLEMRNTYPDTDITVVKNKTIESQFSGEFLRYSNQCRRVAESISSIISYSLNGDFKSRCRELLQSEYCPNQSIQDKIIHKLVDLNKISKHSHNSIT